MKIMSKDLKSYVRMDHQSFDIKVTFVLKQDFLRLGI